MNITEKERKRVLSIAKLYAAEAGYFGEVTLKNPSKEFPEEVKRWYAERWRKSELNN